jgi:hypothetical protein
VLIQSSFMQPSFGGGLVSSCQQTGPALALIDPLRQGLRATGLLNDLVTLTAIRLSSLSAGPDAMRIGVVFTGTDAVRILAKSTGRDKPQNRVMKSTGIGRRPPAGAGDAREADKNPASGWYGAMQQTMRDMMPILSVMKIGRDRPQLCARESRGFNSKCRKHMSCPVLEHTSCPVLERPQGS